MGQLVDKLLDMVAAALPNIKGLDYRALPKDHSQLMNTLATLYKEARAHFFKFPIFEKGKLHVSINSKERMECDYYFNQSFYKCRLLATLYPMKKNDTYYFFLFSCFPISKVAYCHSFVCFI